VEPEKKNPDKAKLADVIAAAGGDKATSYKANNDEAKKLGDLAKTAIEGRAYVAPTADGSTKEEKLIKAQPALTGYKISRILILSTAGARDEWIKQKKNNIKVKDNLNETGGLFAKIIAELFPESVKAPAPATIPTVVSVVQGRFEGMYGFLALVQDLKKADSKLMKPICGVE